MRTRPLLRRLLALLLVVSLLPGLNELIESVEHLAHDGHLPHSAQHDEAQVDEEAHAASTDDEHGCTPTAHHCGCHVSAPGFFPPERPELAARFGVDEARFACNGRPPSARANAPPTPPPTA